MPEQLVNDDGDHVPTARGHPVIVQKKGELALKKKLMLHGLGSLITKGNVSDFSNNRALP
jgi:hypothetical protein